MGIASNGLGQLNLLLRTRSVNALLHDTAPMLVAGNLSALVHHCVKDKLVVLGRPRGEEFLYDMVPIYVLSQLSDSVSVVRNEHVDVLLALGNFDDFLDRPGPMHIFAQLYWIILHLFNDLGKLVLRAAFSKLLGQVVPKWIIHQIHKGFNHAIEDLLEVALSTVFDLFLQEPASSLVPCQHVRVVQQVPHLLLRQLLMSLQGLEGRDQVELFGDLGNSQVFHLVAAVLLLGAGVAHALHGCRVVVSSSLLLGSGGVRRRQLLVVGRPQRVPSILRGTRGLLLQLGLGVQPWRLLQQRLRLLLGRKLRVRVAWTRKRMLRTVKCEISVDQLINVCRS